MIVNFKRLYEDSVIPTFGHDDPTNTALDFHARIAESMGQKSLTLMPGRTYKIGLGVAWEPVVSDDYSPVGSRSLWKPGLILKARSGLALQGVEMTNAGVIDAGYRGEITAIMHNYSRESVTIKSGERICQGIVILVPELEVMDVGEAALGESARGARGFGSSGK